MSAANITSWFGIGLVGLSPVVLQTSDIRSGGGGIRTLDTPLRGILGGSFTTVPSRSVLPLPKPNSRTRCFSLFIAVCGGLV